MKIEYGDVHVKDKYIIIKDSIIFLRKKDLLEMLGSVKKKGLLFSNCTFTQPPKKKLKRRIK